MNARFFFISVAIFLVGAVHTGVAAEGQKSAKSKQVCIAEGQHCTALGANQCCPGHSCRGGFRRMVCQKD
jgi:hypothetical protein